MRTILKRSVALTGFAILVMVLGACSSNDPGTSAVPTPDVSGAPLPATTPGGVNVIGPPSPAYSPTVPYGDHPKQFGRLRVPGLSPPEALPAHDPFPVVVLIHGGFWRDNFGLELMSPLAADLSGRGYATWNLEYRGVGTSGGGWPETAEDVAAGIDHLAELADEYGLDLDRVIVIGHSAGGQLALWSAARGHLPEGAPGRNPVVRPAAVVSLAGVNDLAAADRNGIGAGAVAAFLGRDADRAPLYAEASPIALLPLGVPVLLVHGDRDTNVPLSQTDDYAAAARGAGDFVEVQPVEGGDHFVLIDPDSRAWADVIERLPLLLVTGLLLPPGGLAGP